MNPFRETIVATPWETTEIDVPSIHGQVFEQCLAAVQHVRRQGRSAGLLIHGQAGSGKTHLLRRLRSRLAPQAPSATDREESLYVWVRLQTSPRMIWRTLRRTLVEDWFRPLASGRSQFDRILFHRLAEIRTAEGDLEPWYEYMRDEVPDGLAELMDQIADSLNLDRNTAVAFMHIAFGRHRRDLRAWLAGTSLPQGALERLNLAQDEGTDEEREDEARQIVLMLCNLAGNGLPIVLSFDQVEALQAASGDRDALYAFGQLVATLHDNTSNVVLISSVQSSFATQLKDHSRQPDYDRMTSLGALSLDPLGRNDARELIAVRLKHFADPTLPAADSRPACWPLSEQELETLVQDGTLSPRRLLTYCAERFEMAGRQTHHPEGETRTVPPPPPPAPSIPDFLQSRWEAGVEEKLAANVPEHTEEIVRHGLPLLAQLTVPDAKVVLDEQLADVTLIFEQPAGRTGLCVCNQSNMNSLTTRLKHLKSQPIATRLKRMVVIRDARVPLSKTAKVARSLMEELEKKNTSFVYPSTEVLAAIDALRDLLSDAKSGDLDCHGRSVGPATVAEWLQAQLAQPLRQFVDEVFGTSPGVPAPASSSRQQEELHALLRDHPVVPLADAAGQLAVSVEVLIELARKHPEHFGLLGEPPAVLFRMQENAEISTWVTPSAGATE